LKKFKNTILGLLKKNVPTSQRDAPAHLFVFKSDPREGVAKKKTRDV
jgi:hypothetical protein